MKLKLFILFFTTIVIISGKSKAQTAPEWVSTYPDSSVNLFYSAGIVKDNSGNVYIASGNGQQGSFLIKYDSSGVQQWSRVIKLGIFDEPRGIVMDSFDNVYVGGIRENNTGTFDYTIMKFSPTGDSLWARIYNGLHNFAMDEVQGMAIDDSNNVYVTGYSHGTIPSGDMVTIKYNMNGDSVWVARYEAGGFDGGLSVCADPLGNVFVLGTSQVGAGSTLRLVKYNSSGVVQWNRTPQIFIEASDKLIIADNSGNVYLGGYRNFGSIDYYILKYNPSGDTLWSRSYDEAGRNDRITAITLDAQQNIIATGESYAPGTGTHTATVKYSPDGTFQWSKYFSVPAANSTAIPGDVKCDASGNVYVGGAGSSFYVVKYSPDGIGTGMGLFTNGVTGNNFVSGIVPGSDNVLIGGRLRIQPTGNLYTSIVMKFEDIPTSIQTNSNIPAEYKLNQNYPNPFNPVTTISFSIPVSSEVGLTVYNSLGERIATLIDGTVPTGAHSVTFDAGSLPSGVYYYKLQAGEYSQTRKMILIK